MWFMEFLLAIHPIVRMFLAFLVTMVITLIAWRIMRNRREALLETPEDTPDATEALTLALEITLMAFVFVVALLLAQAWTNAADAGAAVRDEQVAIAEVLAEAEAIGPDANPVKQAALDYLEAKTQKEALALRLGMPDVAQKLHVKSGMQLLKAFNTTFADDKSSVSSIAGSIRDAMRAGGDRISSTPSSAMYGVVGITALLAIIALALAVIVAPARRGPRLLFLGVIVLGVSFLTFIVIEMVNPFLTVVSQVNIDSLPG